MLNTLLPAPDGRYSLDCELLLPAGAAVFDRVLESTSTKDKMAKYQAAVVKQSGAQPVSSHRCSCLLRGRSHQGLSAQLLSLSVVHQDVAPEALALRSSASADQGGTPAPQCNGEWVRIHRRDTQAYPVRDNLRFSVLSFFFGRFQERTASKPQRSG